MRASSTALEENRPPGEDLPVLHEGREVARIEPTGEAVQEVPPGSGPAGENGQVLPAERDRAGPLAVGADRLPAPALGLLKGPAKGPGAVPAANLPRDRRRRRSPPRQLGEAGGAERAARQQDRDALQKIRLALGVPPDEEVQLGRGTIGKGTVITEFE